MSARHYYNDNDPNACSVLRQMIEEGIICDGEVDGRSISDVTEGDLNGFTQLHFFAGFGGWPIAIRRAGIPDSERIITGSCPCQPFSVIGRRLGTEDERHLWPEFARIIAAKDFPRVFGEQTASKDGRDWLARVRHDMEAMGYDFGASDLCSAGVGAPTIRQRLYFVGTHWVGRTGSEGLEGHSWHGDDGDESGRIATKASGSVAETNGPGIPGHACRIFELDDGSRRRVPSQPSLFPLAPRVPGRKHLLHGAGNSICVPLAAAFVRASIEAEAETAA